MPVAFAFHFFAAQDNLVPLHPCAVWRVSNQPKPERIEEAMECLSGRQGGGGNVRANPSRLEPLGHLSWQPFGPVGWALVPQVCPIRVYHLKGAILFSSIPAAFKGVSNLPPA